MKKNTTSFFKLQLCIWEIKMNFDFTLPFKIGSYCVYEKISKGGFGSVYKATSSKYPGNLFAIKFQDLTKSSSFYAYNNEVNALMNLIHRNIIFMYDYGKFDDYGYIVYEHCEHNLKDVILGHCAEFFSKFSIKWNNPVAVIERIFPQIIAAIANIHSNGFIHRDIKPENILITKEGRIKISDFGLSLKVDESVKLEKGVGSLRYMAPEVMTGVSYDGFAADIYATGIVFFQCLQGMNLPWEIPNLVTVKDLVGIGAVQLPPSVPRKSVQIIKLMMSFIPSKRPTASNLEQLFPVHTISNISNHSSILRSNGMICLSKKQKANIKLKYRCFSKM